MNPTSRPADSTPRQVLQAVLTDHGHLHLRIRESLFTLPFENADALLTTFVLDVSGVVCAALDITLGEDESCPRRCIRCWRTSPNQKVCFCRWRCLPRTLRSTSTESSRRTAA